MGIFDDMDALICDFDRAARRFTQDLADSRCRAESRVLALPTTAEGVPIEPEGAYYDTRYGERFTTWMVNGAAVMDDWHVVHEPDDVSAVIPDNAPTRAESERISELVSLLSTFSDKDDADSVMQRIVDRLEELGVANDV